MSTNPTLYHRITERLLELMKAGQLPWLRPWNSGPGVSGLPRNGATGRPYSGVNVLILWASGRPDARWYTFRQAQAANGQVRRGEKGSEVLFFKLLEKADPKTGEDVGIPIARSFHVFNHDQIDWPDAGASEPPTEVHLDAQNLIRESGASIVHGGDQACYQPLRDVITMPAYGSFKTPEGYFATALHELAHWTGHPSRLNRRAGVFGTEDYAFEELVAEISAAFSAAHCGLPAQDTHHAAYLQSWVTLLSKDPKAIVRASKLAREATEHLLGRRAEATAA